MVAPGGLAHGVCVNREGLKKGGGNMLAWLAKQMECLFRRMLGWPRKHVVLKEP